MKIYNKAELKERRKLLRKNQTEAEKRLWFYLRRKQFHNLKFYRQFSIDYYIADFYCPNIKLVIEVDGSQHSNEYNKDYDQIRTELFNSLGITVLRFSNNQVLNKLREVLDEIENIVQTLPNPLFS
jgi:very-short-patch-repair endonuclease